MSPRRLRWTAAAVTALALVTPVQAHASGRPDPAARAHVLAHSGHGRAVVEALGDRLPEAAAVNHLSASRLQSVLEEDPTAWVGEDGQLFYVEKTEALVASAGLVAGAPTASYPESQTFGLHSLPGSTHTIFLDFNGDSVANTYWNSASVGMPARTYTGFTLDADPATFTSAELAYIQQVWRIVAEKYSPFDVDVTTQDPGPAGYNRNGALDTTYGDHVIITDDAGAVASACSGSCSGIALLSTFANSSDTNGYLEPAWVFSSMTWDSPVLTAHTVAHEVGHTFGLIHDGDATHEYASGHGNWFPLMGSGVEGVGQFSKGEYAGANHPQDELAIIAANGAPLRIDDHGDLNVLADPLATGGVANGVIETRADQDVFAVNHSCTTNLTARATGVGAGASLDTKVTVTDLVGNVLASANPASGQTGSWPALPTGMDAQVTVPAGVGTYYVHVEGVGSGDPVYTGYSDYASVGEYVLAISGCDGTMPVVTTPVPPTTTPTTTTPTPAAGTPSAPRIGLATPGHRGHPVTATARWSAPATAGSSAILGYKVLAEQVDSSGRVVKVFSSRMLAAGSRTASLRLGQGHYRFRVVAYNHAGASPTSSPSRVVRAR
ncbi:zinc-dependent metalloprotease family protein [Marmoricola sp. URHA0025 HA25]